jgi:hypothetical protein
VGGGDNFLCIYAFSTQIHVYAVGTVLAWFLGDPSKNYFKKFIVVNDLAFYSVASMWQVKWNIYIYILMWIFQSDYIFFNYLYEF